MGFSNVKKWLKRQKSHKQLLVAICWYISNYAVNHFVVQLKLLILVSVLWHKYGINVLNVFELLYFRFYYFLTTQYLYVYCHLLFTIIILKNINRSHEWLKYICFSIILICHAIKNILYRILEIDKMMPVCGWNQLHESEG